MPRPANPTELIHTPTEGVLYPDWTNTVGDRAVFRVSGLKEFVRQTKNNDKSGKNGFINVQRIERAKKKFAELGWDQHVTIPRNEKNELTRASQNHFKKYIHNKEGSRICTTLYCACILILMAEDFISGHGIDVDIYAGDDVDLIHGVKIVPVVFDLPVKKGGELYEKFLENGNVIRRNSGQAGKGVFSDLCENEETVFSEQVVRAAHDGMGLSCGYGVELSKGRAPSKHERTVYPLSA